MTISFENINEKFLLIGKKPISKFISMLLWGIVLILLFYFIHFVIKNADRPTQGFASYYTAAKLLSEGEEPANFYNDEWFQAKVKRFFPDVKEIYHINLPTISFLLLPLTSFDQMTARIIWTVFNFTILIIALFFLIHKLQFEARLLPAVIIFVLLFQPLYANFAFGQAYVVVFFLLVFSWYAYISGKEALLGFLIGFLFIFKFAGLILWILLALQKKWKSLIWSVGTILFFILLSLPWVGVNSYQTNFYRIANSLSDPTLTVTAYQSINSFFYHFTIYYEYWNPNPLFHSPVLGVLLSGISSLFILAAISSFSISNTNLVKTGSAYSSLCFASFVTGGLIINPIALDYHYIVLILPILLLGKYLSKNQSIPIILFFILFITMVSLALPYTSPKVTKGWLAIFAYPKLYGALGLIGLMLWCQSGRIFLKWQRKKISHSITLQSQL